jgi:transposase, IS5 family
MLKDSSQLNWADAIISQQGLGQNASLDAISTVIDWEPIEALLSSLHSSKTGRPAFAPLLMLRATLLGQWYTLSDPGLEASLQDRLSFRRFVGLSLTADTPDHVSLWRFRQQLDALGLTVEVFNEVNRQFEAQGLLVKSGTLLDASLVEAQAARPAFPREGQAPVVARDKDARWSRKGGRAYFGYKTHIGVDQTSGLIRQVVLTPAHINDTEVADRLVSGDEKAVYADKAYEKKERRLWLKGLGIKDRIMHRSHKNQKSLPHWQARRNRLITPIRQAVERVFGLWKRSYGYRQVRYYSLAANRAQLYFLALATNLKRACVLQGMR